MIPTRPRGVCSRVMCAPADRRSGGLAPRTAVGPGNPDWNRTFVTGRRVAGSSGHHVEEPERGVVGFDLVDARFGTAEVDCRGLAGLEGCLLLKAVGV